MTTRPEAEDGRPTGRAGRGARLITRAAGDALHVRRAFGEPVRHGEVTLVPVAAVSGGSGSGWGDGEGSGEVGLETAEGQSPDAGPGGRFRPAGSSAGQGSGGGGGFGVRVRPVGAYVVRDASVTWVPAIDVSRVLLGGLMVWAVSALALTRVLRRRRR